MDYFDETDLFEDLEGLDYLPRMKNVPRGKHRPPRPPNYRPGASLHEILSDLADDGGRELFEFTYQASRTEKLWLGDSLGYFYDQRWFDDVLRLLKGGKEASVYQCLANATTPGDYLAAKVYRPRRFRNLRNDHLYREGRDRLDEDGNVIFKGGMHHAMAQRTEYGRQLLHTSWLEHENKTLQILHAAGVDCPAPYMSGHNAILMEYIGGPEMAAPTLNTVNLQPEEAQLLFERVLHNIDLMLANDRVHGDLSAFNILYWDGEITLIDFPQAISPRENRNAYRIFQRDVVRICEYFTRQGVPTEPRRIADNLWTAHGHRIRAEVHPSLLDDEDDEDLRYWQNLRDGLLE